jgi:GT2 family glycosyltransferase
MTQRSRPDVTAIVTAYQRMAAVLNTLRILQECDPAPAEILVHVDGGEHAFADGIRTAFPDVRIIVSDERVGPGGGRNTLIAAAAHPIVASFDDDSYPLDRDFFARLEQLFVEYPEASIIDSHVYRLNQAIEPDADGSEWVADFSGGGCAYRRARFLETGGYVALTAAYGMEEVDVGLRLHALGGRVLRARRLRVFHNTDLARHADAAVTAASIANIALLAYLRYPRWLWGMAIAQCLRRVAWLLRSRRMRGIVTGLTSIPSAIGSHKRERHPVSSRALRSYWALRRQPIPAGVWNASIRSTRHGNR